MTCDPYRSTWAAPERPAYTPGAREARVVATLGSIDFVGTLTPGTCYLMQTLTGWWAGGAPRGGPVPWENGDGGTPGFTHMGGRVITIAGLIFTETPVEQFDAFDELAALWAVNRWQTLVVDEPEREVTRQLDVTIRDSPDPQPITDRVARFSLMVSSAGYPLLDVTRSTAAVPSGGVDCTNAGTYPADLTVTLVGPLTNPGLSWSGGSWQYSGSVASGQTIVADLTEQTIRDPATTVHTGHLGAGTWLRLPPGTTRISRTGSGAGTVSLAWRSAWS